MKESQVGIKITVYQSDQATEPCEIKKFQVPRDLNTNFNHLLQEIRKYYKSKELKVFLTDNEGDEISLDSEEDLQTAHCENSGETLKLKVVLEDVPSLDNTNLSAGDDGEGMDLDSADEEIRDLNPVRSSVDGNYILSLMVSVVQCLGLDPVGRTPPASATSYLIRVAAGLSTKLTKSALLMTSIFLLTVLSWFLPAYITNSIVYFILAVTLGLPIATLALGKLFT